MKIEVYNKIIDLALTRRNGIYSYKGYKYIVIGRGFRGFVDSMGKTFQVAFGFTVEVSRQTPKELYKNLFADS
jgi:hypothetical protein